MHNIKLKSYIFSVLLIGILSCNSDIQGIDSDTSFLNSAAASNISKIFDISTDNSGKVKITPLGNGVANSIINFGHGTGADASAKVLAGESTTHIYPEGNYTVTIESIDIAGKKTSNTYPLEMKFRAPEDVKPTINISNNGVSVKATALYANSFLVFFGDVPNEVGTPLATGSNVTHVYNSEGTYDIKVIALSGGAAKTEVVSSKTLTFTPNPFALPITFDNSSVTYFFGTFGGGQAFSKVANPNKSGLNVSDSVGVFTRGFESWSGTYSPLKRVIPFATVKKISVLAFNPDPALIGKTINLELEAAVGGVPGNGVGVKKVAFTKSGEWEELVFDFSTTEKPIPNNALFSQIVFRFNDGFNGEGSGGKTSTFYIDDIKVKN